MLYLVIQVGSTDMNDNFGLPGSFVTWDSKLASTQKPFWLHGGAETEFLKAATMQSHNCAKYLRIVTNFRQVNAKQEKLAQIICICYNLTMFF